MTDLDLNDLMNPETEETEIATVTEEATPAPAEEVSTDMAEQESVAAAAFRQEVANEETETKDPVETEIEAEASAPVETPDIDLTVSEETEVEPTQEEEVKGLPEGMITTYDFLSKNKAKITNCSGFGINGVPQIPEGKYMLFVEKKDEDADLFMIENPNRLAFQDFDPAEITIVGSGIIATNSTSTLYVTKTNVIQFTMADNCPQSMTTFKKMNVNGDVPKSNTEEKSGTAADLEAVKLYTQQASPKLYSQIEELESVADVKAKIIEFRKEIIDINHLVKIQKMMMSCGF